MIYFGKKGVNFSWQDTFSEEVTCVQPKCKGNARMGFVYYEDGKEGVKGKYVCQVHENQKDKKLWLHDCVAVAVYFCEDCLRPTAKYNQA